jgi:transposase, IS5 family
MGRRRYQDTGRDSFLGDFAYERLLKRHPDHFLVKLEQALDWDDLAEKLVVLYEGKGRVGRPPYRPDLIFKMLFIAYLYDVSERRVQDLAEFDLMVKAFLGLAVDESAPDHSTLTVFKSRLLDGDGWGKLVEVFDWVIAQARERGVQMGELQVLDSVHTQANVNPAKDRDRQGQGKGPRDPDARVVRKGKRRVVEADGRVQAKEVLYRGYKTHVSVNADTGLVTTAVPAMGNTADNKAFPALRDHDRTIGLPTRGYGGDKAYDDTDIYERLEAEGLQSGIRLRSLRLDKKDKNKERWEQRSREAFYQAAVQERFRVEQVFGIAKQWHGFERCRYVGYARFRLQSLLTFLVLNAKRVVTLLTGVTFRPGARHSKGQIQQPGMGSMAWA